MIRLQGQNKPSTVHETADMIHDAYYLAASPELYEPGRSNNFEFIVTDLDGIIRPGMVGTESNAYIPNAQEVLRIAIDRSSVPHYSQGVIPVDRGNTTIKFAGKMTFDAGELRILDFIGANSKEVAMAWQNASGDIRTRKVGLASDYKKEAYLVEYTPDYQKIRQWIMYGCWISGLQEDAFDATSNDTRHITATIQYDYAILDTSEEV